MVLWKLQIQQQQSQRGAWTEGSLKETERQNATKIVNEVQSCAPLGHNNPGFDQPISRAQFPHQLEIMSYPASKGKPPAWGAVKGQRTGDFHLLITNHIPNLAPGTSVDSFFRTTPRRRTGNENLTATVSSTPTLTFNSIDKHRPRLKFGNQWQCQNSLCNLNKTRFSSSFALDSHSQVGGSLVRTEIHPKVNWMYEGLFSILGGRMVSPTSPPPRTTPVSKGTEYVDSYGPRINCFFSLFWPDLGWTRTKFLVTCMALNPQGKADWVSWGVVSPLGWGDRNHLYWREESTQQGVQSHRWFWKRLELCFLTYANKTLTCDLTSQRYWKNLMGTVN